MNETMVTVTGNVAGDVVARRVGTNLEHTLVTFRVASSERRWDKASESWIDGDRFTASVNCWRRLADGARALTKGDPVVVTGRLSVREYEVDGVRRYMTEINAAAVGPDLGRCTVQVSRRPPMPAEGHEGAGELDETGLGAREVVGPAGGTAEDGGGDLAALGGLSAPHTGDDAEPSTDGPDTSPEGATITGIAAGERRRSGAGRASA